MHDVSSNLFEMGCIVDLLTLATMALQACLSSIASAMHREACNARGLLWSCVSVHCGALTTSQETYRS
jgi:hypothetical protein